MDPVPSGFCFPAPKRKRVTEEIAAIKKSIQALKVRRAEYVVRRNSIKKMLDDSADETLDDILNPALDKLDQIIDEIDALEY